MTKTWAIREAAKEVTMYQQGGGWIVSAYDPEVGANRVSEEMAYFAAREVVTQTRAERVLRLLGHDPHDPAHEAAYDMEREGGDLASRVRVGLAVIETA